MPPQPLESRVESLEQRVTQLEQLPARIDDLTSQISQLRTEMRGEFSAVRTEMAEQGTAIVTTLRQDIADQGQRADARIGELATEMRVLHEDVISRIPLLQEGWPRPRTPRLRKK